MASSFPAFDGFAPKVLGVYSRDREGFWDAVLEPFLAYFSSPVKFLAQTKTRLDILGCFQGLDRDAKSALVNLGRPLGLDFTQWKSNRLQYFTDAYPVFTFLALWMHENGQDLLLSRFGRILEAGVYAVSGYSILDDNVDSPSPRPVELLASKLLLAEYERVCLEAYGFTEENYRMLHRVHRLFLEAEVREKAARWKTSPYAADRPIDLGTKGLNAVVPLLLCLVQAGRAGQADLYIEMFLLVGAVIQMMDDWEDLEADLAIGHYSIVTLGAGTPPQGKDFRKLARELRGDRAWAAKTFRDCEQMAARAEALLRSVDDEVMLRLVEVTRTRARGFYRKTFGMDVPG